MSEVLKTLSNIRSLRPVLRECTLEQAEAILEKVAFVVEELREAEKAKELEKIKRHQELKKYRDMLAQDGITPEELAALLNGENVKTREPRPARPAKYKFIDENGVVKTWTGQGRTPRALQQALNEGKSLEEFAI